MFMRVEESSKLLAMLANFNALGITYQKKKKLWAFASVLVFLYYKVMLHIQLPSHSLQNPRADGMGVG